MACFMRIVENYPKSSYYTHAKRRISRLMERALGRKWPPKSKENKRETEEPSENNPVKTNIIPGRVAR